MATNKKLSAVITIGGAIAGSLRSAFGDVKGRLGDLGKTVTDLERRQRLLGRAIQEFGRAGKDVTGMRNRYAELTTELDRARRAHERMASAQQRAAKIGGFVKGTAVAVGTAATSGALVSRPLVRAAISRENEINLIKNSGASKEETEELLHAAEKTKQFGVSVTEAIHVVGQLRAAFGDAHHAVEALPLALKAKSGLQLYDRLHGSDLASGDSAYTLAKIAEERGGAKSPEAMAAKFNWAFKGLTGSGGHVSVDQWLNAIRSGKGAVRAMDDAAFFGDTFLMQSMGADRFGTASSSLSNGWIAGRATHSALQRMTDLGLMDRSKVKFDKTGKVKSAVGALVDSQLFIKDPQAWVDKHLIPVMKKRGIDVNDPAQVNEFAAQIASNSNASAILVNRILDSQNIAKDRRNVHKANGVNESDELNKESAAGKIENARKRLNDVEERMGSVILPVLATGMEKLATVLEWLNKKAEENPTALKAVTWGIVGLTAAVAGLATTSLASKLAVAGLNGASALGGVEGAALGASKGIVGFLGKLGTVGLLSGVALGVAKAAGLPDTDEAKGRAALARGDWWAASAYLPAGDFLAAGWKRITTGKAPGVGEDKNDRLARELPAIPKPAAATTAPTTDARQYSFTINQAPGQDSKALADEIERRLGIKAGIKNRSSMFDGVN